MSNPYEEEKLTPGSRKSYDGESTPMADNPEIENPEHPEDPEDKQKQDDARERENDKEQQRREANKKKSGVAALFSAILSSVNPNNGGAEEKIFKSVIDSVTKADAKDKNPNRVVAEALSLFVVVEQPTPDSTDEELANADKTRAIFDTILDSAEDAGLNPKEILEELAVIAEDEERELAQTDEERFNEFEKHVKERLDKAAEEELQKLHAEMKKLRKQLADDTQIEEGVYDNVIGSETLLEELVEVKEDTADQELIEYQREYDREFAEVIVSVFESATETSFRPLVEGEEVSLTKQEALEADHLITLLLAQNDPHTKKQELVAALLESYPVEGTPAEQRAATAMRKRIMRYAKLAGLDERAIADAQVVIAAEELIAPKDEAVNHLESVPALNAFEKKVEEQIIRATASEVREIQDTWRALLANVDPDSTTARQAEEAIKILGSIIQLKDMQAARDRGEDVDFSTLPVPEGFGADNRMPQGDSENMMEEENPKVVDTKNQIKTLEESIEAIESEEMQKYLRDLVKKMKKGMTPDEVADEAKALMTRVREIISSEARTRTENNQQSVNLVKLLGPFNRFLSRSKEGIVSTESAEEKVVEVETVEPISAKDQELQQLEDSIGRVGDNDLEQYLRSLIGQLSEGMPAEKMEAALDELNARAHLVTERMKSEISDDDKSNFMRNKAFMLFAFEVNVNGYRKHLIRAINNDKAEVIPQSSLHGRPQKVTEILSQIDEVHTLSEAGELTVKKFEKYLKKLKKVLASPETLTKDQIDAAYSAVMTYGVMLRDDLMRDNHFVDAVELFLEVEQVQNELYGHVARAYKDEVREYESGIENVVQQKAQTFAEQRGDIFYGRATGYDPIRVEADDRRGYSGGAIGSTVEDLRNLQLQPSPSLTTDLQNVLPEVVRDVKIQDIYADAGRVNALEQQLDNLITEGFRQGKTFQDMSQAREVALMLARQREALQARGFYKSTKDEREYLPEDTILFEGFIHTALGERMQRIQDEIEARRNAASIQPGQRRFTNEDIYAYYIEVKKWAKILVENDIRNHPEKAKDGKVLQLSNQRFQRYNAIIDYISTNITSAQEVPAHLNQINSDIAYMFDQDHDNGGDFLRYFLRNVPDPEGPRKDHITGEPLHNDPYNPDHLLGVEYKHSEGFSSFGLPKSLEDSMAIIAKQYTTTDYKTGGDHELIDAEGNFKYNNFYYWIREQINLDIDYNKDGPINPMQKINLKGDASSVSLAELLILVPEYLSKRNFEINMNDNGEIDAAWGKQTEHPEFTWEQAQQLGAEVEFRQLLHEVRLQYVQAGLAGDKGKFLQLMDALHKANHWVRANNILWLLGLPSSVTNGNQEILDVYGSKEAQGSLGKAISDMLVGYYYLSEVSHFYKANGREKNFNENMFYRFWEPNGANTFVVKMAEGALSNHNEAKHLYGKFTIKRLQAAANDALARAGGDAEKVEKINRLLQNQINEINSKIGTIDNLRNVTVDIGFTENTYLHGFHTYVEKEVFGGVALSGMTKKQKDNFFRLKVRDELLANLKSEYFTDLKAMEVHELDKIPDGDKAGADRKDTYLFLRAKKNKVRFGSIDFGGQTIGSLLDSFDPDQIKKFDYTNNEDDPDNPFATIQQQVRQGTATEAQLRRAIDQFMDKDASPQNHAYFKKNEKMMLAFLKHVNRIERRWINHFHDIPENEVTKDMVQAAFRKMTEKAYGIDGVESHYAWWQARDYVYIWGIGAMLDVTGIGFRVDGKIFNTGKWRSHRGGKDGGGNPHTYDEIGAAGLPFLHAIQIHDLEGHQELGHQSIFSLMQGGHGYNITPRAVREFKARSSYSIAHDSEELYVANMLTSGSELVDLLSTTEVDFSNIVSFDSLGNVVFEYGKARDLFRKWRKAIRYALQKNGIDYREKIWVYGKETTLYEFFFGKKTRAINEIIRRETGRSFDDIYRDPADAVMASIIAAEVYEHRRTHATAHHWSIQNVLELEKVIREFMQEWDLEDDPNGDPEVIMKKNAFTENVFNGALSAYHTGYNKMYASELNSSFWGGLVKGIWAGITTSLSKGKWVH